MTAALRLVTGPQEFLATMRAALGRAHRRAWVETYIVSDDRVGAELAELLAGAAARGADARLLYDPSGSHAVPRRWFAELRRRGVGVRAWGHLAFLGLLRPGVRDHARLVVTDAEAFTGGHNWAERWGPRPLGSGWHDVSVGVDGPVVEDMAAAFERRWPEARRGRIRDLDTGRRYGDVRFVSEGPHGPLRIEDAHLAAFARARRRLWLAHGYFLPTRRVRHALYAAADRGVDVRLLLPGPTDLPIVRRAARAEYGRWLRHRLRLYEYVHTVMHAKYAVVDHDWAAVGSYNAVASSATVTLESALLVERPEFVSQVAGQLRADLARARAITAAELSDRTPGARLVDRLCHGLLRAGGGLVRAGS